MKKFLIVILMMLVVPTGEALAVLPPEPRGDLPEKATTFWIFTGIAFFIGLIIVLASFFPSRRSDATKND